MKILLTYSSLTGNTKKVADSIYSVLNEYNCDYLEIPEVKSVEGYDLIIVGYWIDKALPNKIALEFLKTLREKRVGVFFTLGADPNSKHAQDCIENSKKILEEGNNQIVGVYHCQGKISEKMIEFFKTLPPDHPHALTEEKIRRYEIAAKHPNEEDLRKAKETFRGIVENEKFVRTQD